MIQNKLKLNEDKTEFIIIVSSHLRPLVDQLQPALRVGDATVLPKESVRNLGATFDSEMTMRPHINGVLRSVYCQLRSLGRIRRYLDDNSCATAVQALAISRLDYANSLLAGVPDNALRKLQVMQNNAARLVSRTRRREHITPVMKQLHWLPVRERINHKVLSMTFKALNCDSAPGYLQDLLKRNERRVLLSNSAAPQLAVPHTQRKVGDRAFAVCGPRLWNTLPPELRNITEFRTFKGKLKTHLFKSHYRC
jgi:hypothetical protein